MQEAVGRGAETAVQEGVGVKDQVEIAGPQRREVDARAEHLLRAPVTDERRVRGVRDVEHLEVAELRLNHGRDVVVGTLGEEGEVMDADVHEPEIRAEERVDVIGLHAGQESGPGRVVDVVHVEAPSAEVRAGLVRVDEYPASVHVGDLDVVGAAAEHRADDSHLGHAVGEGAGGPGGEAADVEDADPGAVVAGAVAAGFVEGADVGEPVQRPDVRGTLRQQALPPAEDG